MVVINHTRQRHPPPNRPRNCVIYELDTLHCHSEFARRDLQGSKSTVLPLELAKKARNNRPKSLTENRQTFTFFLPVFCSGRRPTLALNGERKVKRRLSTNKTFKTLKNVVKKMKNVTNTLFLRDKNDLHV